MGGRREREAKGEGRPGRRGPVARLLQCGFFFFFVGSCSQLHSERGPGGGESGPPEISREERLRCPLRTAAPPPPPGLQELPGRRRRRRASCSSALPPPAVPAASQAGRRARSLPRRRPGRPGRLREPAGGAPAQEPRTRDTSQPGVRFGPQPFEGSHRTRARGSQPAGASATPARSVPPLCPGGALPTGNAAPLLLTPGCSTLRWVRKWGPGVRTTPTPSQVPQLWEGAANGARRAPATFTSMLSFPLASGAGVGRTADSRAERPAGRGTLEISVGCFRVCASSGEAA